MKNIFFTILIIFLALTAQAQQFQKVTTGDLVNTPSDSRSINFIDINKDGWDDIFISNGLSGGQDNMLYINNSDGTFSSSSNNAIVEDGTPSVGASFADYDNDGDLDALVTNWYGYTNLFYENDGSGNFSFTPINAIDNLNTYSETASWGDYDQDGLIDLFVTNSGGVDKSNLLYRNLGDSDFESIQEGSWVSDSDLSRNVNWTDYNNDGLLDLFVTNENNTPNDLYTNNGDGTFTKVTSGIIALSARSSMGSSWGDIDNDGDLDLFIANSDFYHEQDNQLFINEGDGFTQITTGQLVNDGGCSFGSAFGDYDNDGDLDLFVANGFCNYNLSDFLYINDGSGNFTKNQSDLPLLDEICSYGAAWGDANEDGFLDLMIAQCKNSSGEDQLPNTLYQNLGNDNNWIKIKLEGKKSNAAAIGAKIRINAIINGEEVWQLRELNTQSGYCGQNSLNTHFGLGDAVVINTILVEWPLGETSILKGIPANTQVIIPESIVNNTKPLPILSDLSTSVYPNPVKDACFIDFIFNQPPSTNELIAQLMDSLGNKVKERKISLVPNQQRMTIKWQIEDLPQGIYFLRFKELNAPTTKIIKVE